mmetsp:Transcript_23674/g.26564  ORF Transcript_23674/g.26564 Transcript_23674/m.26564 type:complete len:88 (+) Transcript_23674:853-1116(+)
MPRCDAASPRRFRVANLNAGISSKTMESKGMCCDVLPLFIFGKVMITVIADADTALASELMMLDDVGRADSNSCLNDAFRAARGVAS